MVILQFCLITLIVLFENLDASTQSKSIAIGKKFLCIEANPQYIANSTCTIRLIDRTFQLYNMSIDLQPNVTLNNMHVSIEV